MIQTAKMMKEVQMTPVGESHFASILAWAQKEEFSEFFRRFPPLHDWNTWERGQLFFAQTYAIYEESTLVGLAAVGNYDFHAKSMEFGLLIDSPQRSLTSRLALQTFAKYVFSYLGNNKLVVKLLKHRSKLADRLIEHGFKIEGTLRQSCNGQDELLLGCLASEYKELI